MKNIDKRLRITTRKGDQGKTSLYGGKRVSKDHIRVEAFGTLDELCSFLGMVKSLQKRKMFIVMIDQIQKDLFLIGSEMAADRKAVKKLKNRIGEDHIKKLEERIFQLEKKGNAAGSCFSVPGKSFLSSVTDVARAVSRRLERKIVTLHRKKIITNPFLLAYLNRLSDLLFLVARQFD